MSSADVGVSSARRRCVVCRMEFEDGDDVTSLPCSHFYHPPCIERWLQDQKVRCC